MYKNNSWIYKYVFNYKHIHIIKILSIVNYSNIQYKQYKQSKFQLIKHHLLKFYSCKEFI